MTLKKLIESTTAASNRSWITQSITFIAGWWKSFPMGTPTPSATTHTLRPRVITDRTAAAHLYSASEDAVLFCVCMSRSLVVLILIAGFSFRGVFDAFRYTARPQRD